VAKQPPMQPDTLRVFADDEPHVKVVVSLAKKNHHIRDIAKATGLSEAAVRKIVAEKGPFH
jgi:hypothetical protein